MVHFYFNSAIESVVKEFEHCIKVYMSDVYENALDTEKEKVINRLQHTNFNYNKQGIILDKENLFELYSFATLSELLQVYKILKSKIKSVKIPKIDGNISNIRNTIYHHNNVLIENKQSNNPHVDLERIESLSNQGFSLEITSYLSINYKYNTLRLIVDMIEHVNFFLSRDECTANRKRYMIQKLESDLRSSEHYYNKLEKKEWVKIYYETIQLIIKNIS